MSDPVSTPRWRAEQLPGQPAGTPSPDILPPGGIPRDGLWFKISPASGRAWLALLAPGVHGWTGISTHPDPDKLVLCARGRGWIVFAQHARDAQPLPLPQAWDVRHSPADGILLVCGTETAVALDSAGERWRLAPGRLRDPNVTGWEKGRITLIGETGHDCTEQIVLSAANGADAPPTEILRDTV